MFSPAKATVHRAPLNEEGIEACRKTACGIKTATVQLGKTLPSLLDEGCDFQHNVAGWRHRTTLSTINQYHGGQWQSWTLLELRRIAEEIALGLSRYSNLKASLEEDNSPKESLHPRAALLMASDATFVMADIGCLLAQFVTVPMLPAQPLATIEHILQETAASVLFVSTPKQIKRLLPRLPHLKSLRLIVVVGTFIHGSKKQNSQKDPLAALRWELPETIDIVDVAALRARAKWSASKARELRESLNPTDIATIVYTLTASGQSLGAMLTHENLSGSVLAAFSALPCLRKGPREVALSFLPLHHIFARGFVYGGLSYGQSLYFSSPRLVMKHLGELKPTVFYTVPRLLEKVYEGWQAAPSKLKGPLAKPQQLALAWAWRLAERYRLETPQSPWYRLQLWMAQKTVLRPLRKLFGGRLRCFISGGAALPAEVMTLLSAAGLQLCQGYGLTEASSTLSFTRRQWRQAGTVGTPMPGVEMAIAPDGEVMVKAPYVMKGYYRHPAETQAVLEPNGWLHTGDRGEFSADGLLTLTGVKKELFKLSIGEYIAPASVEQLLRDSPLVKEALVVGPGRKFCGVLIFPDGEALARQLTLSQPLEHLMKQPQAIAAYQTLVDRVNQTLPFWSTIKRFQLVSPGIGNERLTLLVQPTREARYLAFAEEIDRLYQPLSVPAMTQQARVSQSVSQPQPVPEATLLSSHTRRLHHV